jgi:hypothetical protein
VNPKLKSIEIQCSVIRDHDFAISNAPLGQLLKQRFDKFGKVPVQRSLIPALDQDLVSIAKYNRPETIPFGLIDPFRADWKLVDTLCKHR